MRLRLKFEDTGNGSRTVWVLYIEVLKYLLLFIRTLKPRWLRNIVVVIQEDWANVNDPDFKNFWDECPEFKDTYSFNYKGERYFIYYARYHWDLWYVLPSVKAWLKAHNPFSIIRWKGRPWYQWSYLFEVGRLTLCFGRHGNCHDQFIVQLEHLGFSSPRWSRDRKHRWHPAWFRLSIYNGFYRESDGFTLHVAPGRFDWEIGRLARHYGKISILGNDDAMYTWKTPMALRLFGANTTMTWI